MTFDLWPFWRKNVDDDNSHSNGPDDWKKSEVASLLNLNIFRNLNLEIALAIPALSEWKK